MTKNGSVGITAQESLAYLFDPDAETANRNVYENVGGLLRIDNQGYYTYDSNSNYAELNADGKAFTVYDTKEDGFFPFDSYTYASSNNVIAHSASLNHFFGLTLTTRFVQENDGFTDSTRQTPTTFKFSGDDDVWIFVDDVLVADLGGIHDRAEVTIDFSAGTVYIDYVYSGSITTSKPPVGKSQTTYFEDIFKGTSVALSSVKVDSLRTNAQTLATDTYHTLKFFYLERGGNDSNLLLKYNLKEIPSSSIVKVDQYGEPVADAEFALYAAKKENNTYKYKLDKASETDADTYISLDDLTYTIALEDTENSTKGQITITSEGAYKDKTITPIYYGKTDSSGTMTFLDDNNMPLALPELQEKAGSDNFILREVQVPDGYRLTSDEVWLYLQRNVLYCDNVYTSGAWSAASVMVSASQTIYLNDSSAVSNGSLVSALTSYAVYDSPSGRVSINYYNPTDSNSEKGTLFAVVLKYNGGTEVSDLENQTNWVPIYGNDLTGYIVQDIPTTRESIGRDDFINAVITTAQAMEGNENYSDSVFKPASSGAMQVTLNHLPGDVKTYFSMLAKEWDDMTNTQKAAYSQNEYKFIAENLGYTVAYYWTTAKDLKDATATNTFRVNAEAIEDVSDGFERAFGATIEVPNLINYLAVQKFDEDGNRVNGATFGLYNVYQSDDENSDDTVYYIANNGSTHIALAEDTDRDNKGTATVGNETGTYKVITQDTDSNKTGDIIVTVGGNTYTISPADTAVTTAGEHNVSKEDGTAIFGMQSGSDKGLNEGRYLVREIAAPAGYAINPTQVQVLVTDVGIYANAGTAEDGVKVARGPGYLASNLTKYATKDTIDNTLTWIYETMKVSENSVKFSDMENYNPNGTNGWSEPTGKERIYLEYNAGSSSVLFNYGINTGRYTGNSDVTADSDIRLTTETGWSYYEIYQDTDWGLGNEEESIVTHKNPAANYENLQGKEIANLFSRSTYVQVTDEKVSNLEISKTVNKENASDTTDISNTEFNFTVKLYSEDPSGKDDSNTPWLTGSYPYTVYNKGTGNSSDTVATHTVDGNEVPYTGTLTLGSDGTSFTVTLKNNQYVRIENLPDDAYYVVEETGVTSYKTNIVVVNGQSNDTGRENLTLSNQTTTGTARALNPWSANSNTTQVQYTNTLTSNVDITIRKYDGATSGTSTVYLNDAEFTLYRTASDSTEKLYYHKDEATNVVTWVSDEAQATTLKSETQSDLVGTIKLSVDYNFNGVYYLEETKAPNGYNLLTRPVSFKVQNGTASYLTSEGTIENNTITVPNSAGVELPNTGGVGTTMYTAGGLAMMAFATLGCLMYRGRKRKRGGAR